MEPAQVVLSRNGDLAPVSSCLSVCGFLLSDLEGVSSKDDFGSIFVGLFILFLIYCSFIKMLKATRCNPLRLCCMVYLILINAITLFFINGILFWAYVVIP